MSIKEIQTNDGQDCFIQETNDGHEKKYSRGYCFNVLEEPYLIMKMFE